MIEYGQLQSSFCRGVKLAMVGNDDQVTLINHGSYDKTKATYLVNTNYVPKLCHGC